MYGVDFALSHCLIHFSGSQWRECWAPRPLDHFISISVHTKSNKEREREKDETLAWEMHPALSLLLLGHTCVNMRVSPRALDIERADKGRRPPRECSDFLREERAAINKCVGVRAGIWESSLCVGQMQSGGLRTSLILPLSGSPWHLTPRCQFVSSWWHCILVAWPRASTHLFFFPFLHRRSWYPTASCAAVKF